MTIVALKSSYLLAYTFFGACCGLLGGKEACANQKGDAMESISLISEQVIEFFGELYLHEPEELRLRVQFRDYLGLLSRNMRLVRPQGPLHAHRCVCGTFVLCETPASKECAHNPRCRDCGALPLDRDPATHQASTKAHGRTELSVTSESCATESQCQ